MTAFDQMMAVGFVLLLALAAVWALYRAGRIARPAWSLGRSRAARRLTVVERAPLTPQHALHLVRLGEEELLVATFPGGLVIRHPGSRFHDQLGEVLQGGLVAQKEVRA